MKRPTFLGGVLMALVLAASGAAVFAGLSPVLGNLAALRCAISLLGGAYVVYLLVCSQQRTGRVVVPALWLTAAAVLWWLVPALLPFAAAHAGLIWLVRSLYHYAGVLTALGDLALSLLAFAGAVWALGSGSVFLTLWCFFLVQALFVALTATSDQRLSRTADDSFQQARSAAEAALKSLLNH